MAVINATNFVNDVEKIKVAANSTYIDAVTHVCSTYGVEVEFAATLIKKDPVLRSKIQEEAENLNILKKSARLPI